jgi:ribonuclease P protein component
VRAERISAGTAALRVHLAPNGLAHARFGFAVPKSLGGAVVRNTVRRRLRAALDPRRAELAGCDLVVSAFPAATALRFAELETELAGCLERALPAMRAAVERRSADAGAPLLTENGAVRPGPRRALMPSPV